MAFLTIMAVMEEQVRFAKNHTPRVGQTIGRLCWYIVFNTKIRTTYTREKCSIMPGNGTDIQVISHKVDAI